MRAQRVLFAPSPYVPATVPTVASYESKDPALSPNMAVMRQEPISPYSAYYNLFFAFGR
jgi:hypothetical protein